MHSRSTRTRYLFATILIISAAGTLGAIIALGTERLTLLRGVCTFIIGVSWVGPALLAIRYRSALTTRSAVRNTEQSVQQPLIHAINASQANLSELINDSRKKASRHEYWQEQSLSRIETGTRSLMATATPFRDWTGSNHLDVLLVTSNGAGLGHVSRLLALADHLPSTRRVELLTLSKAYKQIAKPGLTVHYFPSSEAAPEDTNRWNRIFREYVRTLLDQRKPSVVVFDGTWVYSGLSDICRAIGIPLIWMQRGLWKTDVDQRSVQRHSAAQVVDHVIIPGDLAGHEQVDVGQGVSANYVGPIVRTSRSDLLRREQACQELGLDPSKRYVLLNLGGTAIGDPTSLANAALASVRELRPKHVAVQVVSPLDTSPTHLDGLIRISAYPIMRYALAFEFAVSAAGYNSAQEAASLGLPTILLPNAATKTDDQVRRAKQLEERGLCIAARSAEQLRQAINCLATPTVHENFRARVTGAKEPNGAAEAAAVVEKIRLDSTWYFNAETIEGAEHGND